MSLVPDLAIESQRVLTEEGLRPAAALLAGERIAAVVSPREVPGGCPRRDFGTSVIMPGLVDSHVHINEPGRTDWEGFWSATRAAAAGGVTTLVDMPLNSIPATTTRSALETKQAAARGRLFVDCGFWGGVVPDNASELPGMIEDGVCGFKAFLVPSGVDEFPHVAEADLRRALPILARGGVPLLAHAEVALPGPPPSGDGHLYATYLATRPASWENEAIRLLIRLGQETGAAIHVVHLSSAEAVADIEAAQEAGLVLSAETCPHYLTLTAEGIPDGANRLQVQPADPGRGEPGGALGGPAARCRRHGGVRSLALRTRAQGSRLRRLSHGVGRHRFASAAAARGLDRSAEARGFDRGDDAVAQPATRRARGPRRTQGAARRRLRR